MAGWSGMCQGLGLVSPKGSGGSGNCGSKLVDSVDQEVKSGFDDFEVEERRVKCLFNKILLDFTNEVESRGFIRPMPVVVADGKVLELFDLFKAVRERGGYDQVTVNDLWSFVAVDLGLHAGLSVAIKVVYHNYLRDFEACFAGNGGERLENLGERDSVGNLSWLMLEVEKEFKGLLERWPNQVNKNDRLAMMVWKENDGTDHEQNGSDLWDVERYRHGEKCVGKRSRGVDENSDSCDHNATKRRSVNYFIKQELIPELLNWMTRIAVCPTDPSVMEDTEPSGCEVIMQQAIMVREGLMRRSWSDAQRKQKANPSMYDDDRRSIEGIRSSGRLSSIGKSRACSCCSSGSTIECKRLTTRPRVSARQSETNQKKKAAMTGESSPVKKKAFCTWNCPRQFDIPVGDGFQACVPEWTGEGMESDPKWIGTQVWPPTDGNRFLPETNSVPRRKLDPCGCPVPGSVNCVRFHTAENRMKVKLEVGKAFFYWGFHEMGEEVSLHWTKKEEKRFKSIMISDPPSKNESFWIQFPDCFRKKTRKDLVSYFWNVFMIRRRSYQNRVTPRNVDSDDESEFGSVSGRYGEEAITVPLCSKLMICVESKQCTDYEDSDSSFELLL